MNVTGTPESFVDAGQVAEPLGIKRVVCWKWLAWSKFPPSLKFMKQMIEEVHRKRDETF